MADYDGESEPQEPLQLTLIGAGTIGLSFTALHLQKANRQTQLRIYDTRPDLQSYVETHLPSYFGGQEQYQTALLNRGHQIIYSQTLESAVRPAEIVQEQGPENLAFKQQLWPEVEKFASKTALLWSSTSGITATQQSKGMKNPGRLIVVHPYNPPHIMPLLEVVTTPHTEKIAVIRTIHYWKGLSRTPVVIKKEVTGFVANRLAFALLKEAISLVQDGVIDAADLDKLVESSMGPRWAAVGPFRSYHMGGGARGLEGFMENIGGTVQACWDDARDVNVDKDMDVVYEQVRKAYGDITPGDLLERDGKIRKILDITKLN